MQLWCLMPNALDKPLCKPNMFVLKKMIFLWASMDIYWNYLLRSICTNIYFRLRHEIWYRVARRDAKCFRDGNNENENNKKPRDEINMMLRWSAHKRRRATKRGRGKQVGWTCGVTLQQSIVKAPGVLALLCIFLVWTPTFRWRPYLRSTRTE